MLAKRIISILLVAVTLLSSVLAISVSAEGEEEQTGPVYTFNTSRANIGETDDYFSYYDSGIFGKKKVKIDTPEERISIMDLRLVKGDLELYLDEFSGEVAVKNVKTGAIIFTNPYDAASLNLSNKEDKYKALSQIIIYYEALNSSEAIKNNELNSFQHASLGGQDRAGLVPSQIQAKYIPNGVRVEYSIGTVDNRSCIPEFIDADIYISEVEAVFDALPKDDPDRKTFDRIGRLKQISLMEPAPGKTLGENGKKINQNRITKYPFIQRTQADGSLKNYTLVVSENLVDRERKMLNGLISKYCPNFNYERIDRYYREIGYNPPTVEATPLFNVALEYTLEDDGFSVRLPANGIRFDETSFRITDMDILPYLGSTFSNNDGYVLYPDGSGALITNERLSDPNLPKGVLKKDIYDEDFGKSYLDPGHKHYEKVRYPVFGMVETRVSAETGESNTQGFLAIVEKGDTMSQIHLDRDIDPNLENNLKAGKVKPHYVRCWVKSNPRPFDKITTDTGAEWTVISDRKYTGDYKIRYVILSGEDASYVGMAKAYRKYLESNKVLTKIDEKSAKEDLPLYIESFGSIETTKRFLSIPYKTNVALTTFENVSTMYSELSKSGINNVSFILTGFGEGGLTNDTVPYDIDWDSTVEKGMSFKELLAEAKEKGYGVYPDFDFAFVGKDEWFDGLSFNNHAVKRIDGRYSSKREYSASRQTVINYYELAISPAFFSRFYEHLAKDYSKLDPQGISLSTLGMYLYSDFDEDDPYNREDSKNYIVEAFKYFKEDQKYSKVITAGGNAYTWQYVDTITDVATESSSHRYYSATVPFLGMVLHGYMETATTPINMEGNADYAILRAIENGTALKFLLSYDNTELLKKEESTSVYYSVRYDIWFDTLLEYYNKVNTAIGDVQAQTITEHKFIDDAIRVPDNDELLVDAEATIKELLNKDFEESETLREKINRVATQILFYEDVLGGNWRDSYADAKKDLDDALTAHTAAEKDIETKTDSRDVAQYDVNNKTAEYNVLNKKAESEEGLTEEEKKTLETVKAELEVLKKALEKAEAALKDAEKALEDAKNALEPAYLAYVDALNARRVLIANIESDFVFFAENFDLLEQNGVYTAEVIAKFTGIIEQATAKKEEWLALDAKLISERQSYFDKVFAIDEEVSFGDEITIGSTEEEATSDYNKYVVAESTVVYEKYSGGKELILNFNNFDVKVEIGGKTYFVAAYGYVIL